MKRSALLTALLMLGMDQPATAKTAIFVDPAALEATLHLSAPPANDSAETRKELVVLHAIQSSRTDAELAKAQSDSKNETIFLFATILGDRFTASALPATAALSEHIANDEHLTVKALKGIWERPRPFVIDTSLHAACGGKETGSYPSGHTTIGYLEALALIEIVPEQRDAILARAADFAHNRMVCSQHYPSDLEAGKQTAYALNALMVKVDRYKAEVDAARVEVRKALGLAPLAPRP